jgi:hypothetical protein
MTTPTKYSWFQDLELKTLDRLKDTFRYNEIVADFENQEIFSKLVKKIAIRATEYNPYLRLKIDRKTYQRIIFTINQEDSHLDFVDVKFLKINHFKPSFHFFIKEKYPVELFKIFFASIEEYLELYIKLLHEKEEFLVKQSKKTLLFSELLDKTLYEITSYLEYLQNSNAPIEMINQEMYEVDEFLESVLYHIDFEAENKEKISLTHPIYYDLIEIILKHRFLFQKGEEFIYKLSNRLEVDHPLHDHINEIYVTEIDPANF